MKNFKINHNGFILPASKAFAGKDNRALKYGDGLFETIRMFNGKFPFIDLHMERLFEGMEKLHLTIPVHYSKDYFENEIHKITGDAGNARIRITVYRSGGGLYTPLSNDPAFWIESREIESDSFLADQILEKADFYPEPLLHFHPFSSLKTCNALPYVISSIFKQKNGLDEVILLNNCDRLVESTSGNIFLISGHNIHTPALTEGCISGVMRKIILQTAPKYDWIVTEGEISLQMLHHAQEVFISNAISGIRAVKQIGAYAFETSKSQLLLALLNQMI